VLESNQLTTGTPESNGLFVRMEAFMLMQVRINPADVRVVLHVNDVLTKALDPYTGDIRARVWTRVTDREDTGAIGTTVDFIFGVTASCVPDADPRLGSVCDAITTMNALVPGAASAGNRAIWQLDQVQVFDAGGDGDVLTAADNTVYLRQGVFVP
jgi:hypothetical protein